MTSLALILVLSSALIHAVWNLIAKRAGQGLVFIWIVHLWSVIFFAPVMAYTLLRGISPLESPQIIAIGGAAVIHLGYFVVLYRAYRLGDLSLVYPLARGSGPLLATAAAILFFGETPTLLALFGASLIGIGGLALTGDPRTLRKEGSLPGVMWALITGLSIAVFTIWDHRAVNALAIPPIVFMWSYMFFEVVILLPYIWMKRSIAKETWRLYRRESMLIGFLTPLAYLLILIAFSFSPVSYIAPAREVGSLIAVLLGMGLLAEGNAMRRLGAAGMMVLGVVALALG